MEYTPYDFDRICRVCKNNGPDLTSLFDGDGNPTSFDEMLMYCTSLQIYKEDGLPPLICKFCANRLLVAYGFRQQCELTDQILRAYAKVNKIKINNVHVKNEIEEDDFVYAQNSIAHTVFSDMRPLIRAKENPGVVIKCPTCLKIFTTMDGLRCHQRIHTGNMFQCKLCDKKYTRMNHLHRHELSHAQLKMYVCKICNKGLTRYEHLKRHLVTHLKDKPFPCSRCNRTFSRTEHLNNHLQRCKGEPVHVCDVCNKNFIREDRLIAHRVIHEGQDNPILPTVDTLDEVENYYCETEYDENKMSRNNTEADIEVDYEDVEFLEPQVDIEEKEIDEKLNWEGENWGRGKVDGGMAATEEFEEEKMHGKKKEEKMLCEEKAEKMCREEKKEKICTEDKEKRTCKEEKSCREEIGKNESKKENESIGEKEIGDEKIFNEERESNCYSGYEEEYNEEKNHVGEKKHDEDKGRSQQFSEKNRYFKAQVKQKEDKSDEKRRKEQRKEKQQFVGYARNGRENDVKVQKLQNGEAELCDKESLEIEQKLQLEQSAPVMTKRGRGRPRKDISATPIPLKVAKNDIFQCQLCEKSFNDFRLFERHEKLHERLKTYQCEICEKEFSRPYHLKRHMTSHQAHKLITCQFCKKNFTHQEYLFQHIKLHINENTKLHETDFECMSCKFNFESAEALYDHDCPTKEIV